MSGARTIPTKQKVRVQMMFARNKARRVLARSSPEDYPFILMYHRVIRVNELEYPPEPGLWVDAGTFEKQIEFLSERRNIVPVSHISEALKHGKSLPKRACAVTFDDGWLDNYTNALPVLQSYSIPATIFLAIEPSSQIN